MYKRQLLNRFGPAYFEISQLVGISVRQYEALEPVLREHRVLTDGETVSLIPDKAPKVLEAVTQLLRAARRRRTVPRPQTLRERAADLAGRCRILANQLVELYNSCHSPRDREFILEVATELRLILMQPGLD